MAKKNDARSCPGGKVNSGGKGRGEGRGGGQGPMGDPNRNPNRRSSREFSPTTYAPRLNSKAAVEHAIKFFPKMESRYSLKARRTAWRRIIEAAERHGVKVTGTMRGKAGLLNKSVIDLALVAATTGANNRARRDLAWEIRDYARRLFLDKTPPEYLEEKERKNWGKRQQQRCQRRLREVAWKAATVVGFAVSPEVILAGISKVKGGPELIIKLNQVVGAEIATLDMLKKAAEELYPDQSKPGGY